MRIENAAAPTEIKKVLSIAGSDCSGGAGIQADSKTCSAHGVYAMSVITCVVAENTVRVLGAQDISPALIEKQIDAVFEDIPPDAVKIGMLPCRDGMLAVSRRLRVWRPAHVVIDPVMVAKGGCALMAPEAIDTFLAQVVPLADVITPNLPEAESMTGYAIATRADMEKAARRIYDLGCRAVLVKGGHGTGEATDVLFDGRDCRTFSSPRINTKNTHGTGCTYASAIACNLALGFPLFEAVERAKQYITQAIAHGLPLGKGCGPTNHFHGKIT